MKATLVQEIQHVSIISKLSNDIPQQNKQRAIYTSSTCLELTKESYFLASVNDSSLKTKGTTDNVSTDTATKKSTDGSETSKAASGKDDKEEPMDVDNSAEKEEKSKSVTKTSDASGTATTTADSKSSTKEQPSVTAT